MIRGSPYNSTFRGRNTRHVKRNVKQNAIADDLACMSMLRVPIHVAYVCEVNELNQGISMSLADVLNAKGVNVQAQSFANCLMTPIEEEELRLKCPHIPIQFVERKEVVYSSPRFLELRRSLRRRKNRKNLLSFWEM